MLYLQMKDKSLGAKIDEIHHDLHLSRELHQSTEDGNQVVSLPSLLLYF